MEPHSARTIETGHLLDLVVPLLNWIKSISNPQCFMFFFSWFLLEMPWNAMKCRKTLVVVKSNPIKDGLQQHLLGEWPCGHGGLRIFSRPWWSVAKVVPGRPRQRKSPCAIWPPCLEPWICKVETEAKKNTVHWKSWDYWGHESRQRKRARERERKRERESDIYIYINYAKQKWHNFTAANHMISNGTIVQFISLMQTLKARHE